MTEQLTVAKLLSDAADLIERRGLHQRAHFPEVADSELGTCPLCASAALHIAAGGTMTGVSISEGAGRCGCWLSTPIYDAARAVITAHVGSRLVVEWNDKEGRTAAEVVQTLRALAESC